MMMKDLRVQVDDELLERAAARAKALGVSVDRVLVDALRAFAGGRSRPEQALEDLLNLSTESCSRRIGGTWAREDLQRR